MQEKLARRGRSVAVERRGLSNFCSEETLLVSMLRSSLLYPAENRDVRASVHVVCVQVGVTATSGRALHTLQRAPAAWRAVARRRRPRAAAAQTRLLRRALKIAICAPPCSARVYRMRLNRCRPAPYAPWSERQQRGTSWRRAGGRLVAVASRDFRGFCKVADEASDVRVEGSGAFGRMRGVPRACAEAAGRYGN